MRNAVTIAMLLICFFASGCWAAEGGGRSAWLCFYGFGVILLYLAAIHWGVCRNLQALRTLNRTSCWSGASADSELKLKFGRYLLPSAYIAIEEGWKHQSSEEWMVCREVVRPGMTRSVTLKMELPGLSRGLYRLEWLTVGVSDAFGLLRFTRRLDPGRHELLALPRPLPLDPARDGAGYGPPRVGRLPQRQASSPLLRGTRPYTAGDPLNRIHWRSTARTGELRAKETEQPGADRLLLCLDAAGGPANAAAFETAIEAAAGLAKRALELGLIVRFAAGDRQGLAVEAQGKGRLLALLQRLALLRRGGGRPLAAWVQREALHLGPGGGLAVVTAQPDEALLRLLRGRRSGATQLVYVHGSGDGSAVERWRRQAEAAGCRFTAVAAGSGHSAEGGEGHGADSIRDAAGV